MKTYFVLRTDAFKETHYFVGAIPPEQVAVGICFAISPYIFNALDFKTKADAEDCIECCNLGEDWFPVECHGPVTSKGLETVQ